MKTAFYSGSLSVKTGGLINLIQSKNPDFLNDFYLTGGTALSLLLGHRESEDLDWFNTKDFDPVKLQPQLEKLGKLTAVELEANTLNAYLDGVKIQFLGYRYQLLEPLLAWGKIKLSSPLDIACTKLQTIGVRGSKKDFIDLFWLLKQFSIEELFAALKKKYKGVDYNQPHLLKSLVYFINADNQPMPRMRQNIQWEEIKQILIDKVRAIKI